MAGFQHCSICNDHQVTCLIWRTVFWNDEHWNGNLAILMIFLSLAAPKVVKMTTFGAASDENFVKMTAFPFQRTTWWVRFLLRNDLLVPPAPSVSTVRDLSPTYDDMFMFLHIYIYIYIQCTLGGIFSPPPPPPPQELKKNKTKKQTNKQKNRPIARPWVRDMWYLMWVHNLNKVPFALCSLWCYIPSRYIKSLQYICVLCLSNATSRIINTNQLLTIITKNKLLYYWSISL